MRRRGAHGGGAAGKSLRRRRRCHRRRCPRLHRRHSRGGGGGAAAADVQIPSYSKLRGASLLSGSQNNDRKYHRIFFYYCSVLCFESTGLTSHYACRFSPLARVAYKGHVPTGINRVFKRSKPILYLKNMSLICNHPHR